MNRLKPITILLLLAFFFGACQREEKVSSSSPSPRTLARVNNEVITEKDFSEFLKLQGINLSDKVDDEIKKNLLLQAIEERLILQEAKRIGIDVTDEELDRAITAFREQMSSEDLQKEGGLDEGLWRKRLKSSILLNKVIASVALKSGDVSDEEAQEYYNINREGFKRPEEVRALQIVVATEYEAKRILNRLKAGKEDFEKAAREYSLSPDREKGGDLGYFGRGEMPEEFEEVVFSLKIGELSQVAKSPYGYHIFKLIDRRKAGVPAFSYVKGEIKERLKAEKEERVFSFWLDTLKSNAVVEVYGID